MKLLLFSSLLITCKAHLLVSDYILSDRYIDHLNEIDSSWTAGRNFDPKTPIDHLKRLCGVKKDPSGFKLPLKPKSELISIPDYYDAREAYPECPSVSEIGDQGACGSDWAFASAQSMSDRYCIQSNGTFKFHVSADDLVTCCDICGDGCDGGYPANPWYHWVDVGFVSGGPYHSHQGCKPYEILPCGHPPNKPPPPGCDYNHDTPACVEKCESTYNVNYTNDLHTGRVAYSVAQDVTHIQTEIFKHGPVEGVFGVFGDFFSYKSGVYRHTKSTDFFGLHAIRILGWGTENGTDYWLCANSWSHWWGDEGFFKILRGVDECGIESEIIAGLPSFY